MNKQNLLGLKKTMLVIAAIYLVFLIVLFLFQRNLQYHPRGTLESFPSYQLKDFSEEILTAEDGVKILSWYKKPENEDKKIILYFHGNAGNLGERTSILQSFANQGFGVLAISYRGYPGSLGRLSESGLIKDSEAALKFLLDQGYSLRDIVFLGESLGSGIATQLAARFNPYAIILESPFSSIASVAQKIYWFVPVNLILLDKFDSIKYAKNISSPVLILHGTNDSVVPYNEGQKLFAEIKSEKKFVTIEGGGHLKFGDEFVVKQVKEFLNLISEGEAKEK